MRIKQIELNGFKSFRDRTTLELPLGVTAIVGPNGCGKSNVVDAIRWVLGEQSPKHLRGAAMEDVVFNGNTAHGPLGMAEVSLLMTRDDGDRLAAEGEQAEGLEDSDDLTGGGLPPGLATASEIVVTRRYFRSGESEYFINKTACRLRDITELFLGTGVGTRAYAIIEQGRVDQLLNAKPDELRLFLEEAAGTTRFRSRRIAAERKMERTRENLVRVQDVLRELDRQVGSLERQARRAEEYRSLKEELRDLDLVIAARRFDSLSHDVAGLNDALIAIRAEEARLQAEIERSRGTANDARAALTTHEERLRIVEESIATQRTIIADARARAAALAERVRELSARESAIRMELPGVSDRRAVLEQDVRGLVATVERLAAEQPGVEREREEAESERARLLEAGEPLERFLEEAKNMLVEAVAEDARLRNLLAALRHRRDELEGRRRQVDDVQRGLAERLRENADLAEGIGHRLDRLEAELDALAERRSRAEITRGELLRMEESQLVGIESLKADVLQLQTRHGSLRELQERYEGCARGVATLSGRERTTGDVALLARLLRVPADLERAVAVALGTRLTQLVVPDCAAALEELSWLGGCAGGSATLIPRVCEGRPATIVPPGPRLLDRIEVEAEHWSLAEALLGNVLIAQDLTDAMTLWRSAGYGVVVVTPNGEAIDALGAMTGGSEPPVEEAVLAREREGRELEERVAALRARLALAEDELRETRTRLVGFLEEMASSDQRQHEVRLERVATEKDRERCEAEHDRITAELEAFALQAGGLAGEESQLREEVVVVERRAASAGNLVGDRRERLAQAQAGVSAWRTAYAAAEERRRAAGIAAMEISERLRGARNECQGREEALGELVRREQALQGQKNQISADRTEASSREQQERTRCQQAEETLGGLNEERATLAKAISEAQSLAQDDDAAERTAREYLEDVRERRGNAEVAVAERRLQIDHLGGQLTERYGIEISALTDVPRGDDEAAEEHAARVEAIRLRLGRLGDVNQGAIEELNELRERQGFLASQRDDLERSLEDLRRTIAKLVRTSRLRFEETFTAANEKLRDVFPKLFPGGSAQLQLTAPQEEGGEPGVEIVVQPAGKKLQSLTLLSGGEKALTAVALILSLFLIRPTPFCLLDEVDAPLDEANIGRFNQVIREMADKSQFVLITHNRRTMEVADTLYGITMEQAGVSKVVSVRLREAA